MKNVLYIFVTCVCLVTYSYVHAAAGGGGKGQGQGQDPCKGKNPPPGCPPATPPIPIDNALWILLLAGTAFAVYKLKKVAIQDKIDHCDHNN